MLIVIASTHRSSGSPFYPHGDSRNLCFHKLGMSCMEYEDDAIEDEEGYFIHQITQSRPTEYLSRHKGVWS